MLWCGHPLVFTGLGLTSAQRAVYSISVQTHPFTWMVLFATLIAIACPLPNGLHQLALISAAAVVGGVISMLPVIVNKYTKVNPVVLAIMANSIFYYFGLSIISSFFLEKSGSWEATSSRTTQNWEPSLRAPPSTMVLSLSLW